MEQPNSLAPWDRWWVNVNEPRDLQYWTEKFGVSEQEIRQAVASVGVSVAAVKRYLGK